MKKSNNKTNISNSRFFSCLILIVVVCQLSACGSKRPEPSAPYVPDKYLAESTQIDFDSTSLNNVPGNPYPDLSVPTYITKVDDTYFIVDCYHMNGSL